MIFSDHQQSTTVGGRCSLVASNPTSMIIFFLAGTRAGGDTPQGRPPNPVYRNTDASWSVRFREVPYRQTHHPDPWHNSRAPDISLPSSYPLPEQTDCSRGRSCNFPCNRVSQRGTPGVKRKTSILADKEGCQGDFCCSLSLQYTRDVDQSAGEERKMMAIANVRLTVDHDRIDRTNKACRSLDHSVRPMIGCLTDYTSLLPI
jgi:hypothetical protein